MNYNKESIIGFTLIVGIDYHVYLQPSHRGLLFLPEKRVIDGVTLVGTWLDKKIIYVTLDY